MKHQSELTLPQAIEKLEALNPIKIVFNDIVLYNDYDSDIPVDENSNDVFGETAFPTAVIPHRLWLYDRYVVNSIKIDIVHHHHSIVTMRGKFLEDV